MRVKNEYVFPKLELKKPAQPDAGKWTILMDEAHLHGLVPFSNTLPP